METLPTDNVTAKVMPAVDTNIRGPFGSAVQGPIPDVPEPAFGSEVAAQDGPSVLGAAAFTDTGAGARPAVSRHARRENRPLRRDNPHAAGGSGLPAGDAFRPGNGDPGAKR